MDSSYDDEFVRSYPSSPNFRGYTKDNCKLLEQQNMYKQLYDCTTVYDRSISKGRYCSPMEHMSIWNPDTSSNYIR
jgi:hypothetical protein